MIRQKASAAILGTLALAFAGPGAATTFLVNQLTDSGLGSLRQAVLTANAATGPDEIVFAPELSGTITLTSGEIAIMDDLAINGPGHEMLTVSGNDLSRIFNIAGDTFDAINVTLSGLTLTRGYIEGEAGGAVLANDTNLTITNSVISNSKTQETVSSGGCGGNVAFVGWFWETLHIESSLLTAGVALDNDDDIFALGGNLCAVGGTVLLERSEISNGIADFGAGLHISSDVIVRFSSILGNQSGQHGGGFYAIGRSLTIESSTIAGNSAADGGGIYAYGPDLSVFNSTISGNTAAVRGGGIFFLRLAQTPGMRLRLATIANNTAGTACGNLCGGPNEAVQIDHSIIADGTPRDLGPFLASYSLIEDTDSPPVGSNNLVGVDPLLGPLADNGGLTLTHALLPGSPAIDAGDPAIVNLPGTDQRSLARVFGPAIDLGAVEAQPSEGIVDDIPTLSQVGLLALAALLCVFGVWRLRSSA